MKREKLLQSISITGSNEFNCIDVTVEYQEGGFHYGTGNYRTRGLYLSVSPYYKNYDSQNRLISTTYRGFSGVVKFQKELKRFSAKQLNEFVPTKLDIIQLVNYVAEKNNITLPADLVL